MKMRRWRRMQRELSGRWLRWWTSSSWMRTKKIWKGSSGKRLGKARKMISCFLHKRIKHGKEKMRMSIQTEKETASTSKEEAKRESWIRKRNRREKREDDKKMRKALRICPFFLFLFFLSYPCLALTKCSWASFGSQGKQSWSFQPFFSNHILFKLKVYNNFNNRHTNTVRVRKLI